MTTLPKLKSAVPYLLLATAIAAAYANVYPNTFVLDDGSLLASNKFLLDPRHLPDIFTHLNYSGSGLDAGFYRPVPMLLHFVVAQIFDISTVAFHTLNILVQIANAGLVYTLGRRIGFLKGASFAAALLWGLHPLHTEAITYMSSTPEALWVTFSLLGLLVLLPDFALPRMIFASFYFLLALGSKETAIVFPALAAAILYWTQKGTLKDCILRLKPLWIISLLYGCAILLTNYWSPPQFTPQQHLYENSLWIRILTCLATLPVYARLIVAPYNLHMEWVFPLYQSLRAAPVLVGLGMATASAALIFLGKSPTARAVSFGLFWFAAALSPATGILVATDALISEHWLYMPLVGLFLGLAQATGIALQRVNVRSALAAIPVLLIALFFAFRTHEQNKIWRDPPTFYDNVAANGGKLYNAHIDLGIYYAQKGDFNKSVAYYKDALQDPPGISIPMEKIHTSLAASYLRISPSETLTVTSDDVRNALARPDAKIALARAEIEKALKLKPDYAPALLMKKLMNEKRGNSRLQRSP